MFTIRKRANRLVMVKSRPAPEILMLVSRMRALAIKDEEIALLLEELAPHLPTQPDAAAIANPG